MRLLGLRAVNFVKQLDPRRVYIAGLSAGGAAAAIMGDAYFDLYAAVGVHSGLPSGAASDLASALDAMRVGVKANEPPARLIPTIVFHGDKDPIVHPRNGEAVAVRAMGRSNDLQQTTEHGQTAGGHAYVRITYTDQEGRTMCEHWRSRGGGHAWAGGSRIRLSHRSARSRRIKRNRAVFLRTLAERLISLLPVTQEKVAQCSRSNIGVK